MSRNRVVLQWALLGLEGLVGGSGFGDGDGSLILVNGGIEMFRG